MSSLLRGHQILDDGTVRVFERGPLRRVALGRPVAAVDAGVDERDGQIRALAERIAAMEREKAEAVAAARLAGEAQGREAAVRDEARQRAALESAIAGAQKSLETELAHVESLAPLIAGAALDRVLGNGDHFRVMVAEALRVQLARLKADTVLWVRVSARDFTESASLEAIAAPLRDKSIRIERDPEAPAGTCTLALRLGQIEMSLPDYRRALAARLVDLANAGASR